MFPLLAKVGKRHVCGGGENPSKTGWNRTLFSIYTPNHTPLKTLTTSIFSAIWCVVYGYFQKSIYGIYFTFPTIRSGGWESDLLYRVIETRKKLGSNPPPPPPVCEFEPISDCT